MPRDLTYKDSGIEIKDGKILNKCKLSNHELFKYIAFRYGNRIAVNLLSRLINFSYDVIRDKGNTLGYEINISHKDIYDKVKSLRERTWKKVCEIEKTTDNDYIKLIKELHELSNQKVEVQKLLQEDTKGTNLDELGYIRDRLEEYYQMVVEMDYTTIGDNRVLNTLAEGTRTCCSYQRFSIDPRAYGYHKHAYIEGMDPYDHMLDCKSAREALYIKGQGVAKQGYFSKRISVSAGNNFANWNRQVENGFKIVSPQYGSIGSDPRRNVVLNMNDLGVDDKDFEKKYKDDKELIHLHEKINDVQNRYKRLTNFVKKYSISGTFASVYHFNQFFQNLDE